MLAAMAFTPVELTKNGKTEVAETIQEETRLRFDGWLPTGQVVQPNPKRHVEVGEVGTLPELKAAFARYELRPNGTAAHDVAEIQAALADVPAGGGVTLSLPANSDLELGASSIVWPINKAIHLVGAAKDSSRIHYAGAGYAVDMMGSGLGSALPYTSSVRDSYVSSLSIIGPNDGTGLGGVRMNRCFHCTLEDLHIYGFTKNTSVFGAAVYMTASFYNTVRKVHTWDPAGGGGVNYRNYYGLRMDNAQDGTPPFFNLIEDCSFYRCDRGAEVQGNGNLFLHNAFEQCAEFGVTSTQGVNNKFINCWFEGIYGGSTAMRLGSAGTAVNGYIVEGNRFSTSVAYPIEVFAKRSHFRSNVMKPGYTTAITEKTGSASNVYEDNFIDDAPATALPVGGTGIVLLAGSKSKVKGTGAGAGVAAITVGASPYTYTNADGVSEAVYISGGTVSAVAKNGITVFGASPATVWLEPGEDVTVTYSAAPTMAKDRK